MTRLWFDSSKGRVRGVLSLTDEQALAMLEQGRNILPVEGTDKLIAKIGDEITEAEEEGVFA